MRLSQLSQNLQASGILRIGAEVRALAATGKEVTDLSVGDFAPKYFRIPTELEEGIVGALRDGESSYPPASGMEVFRTGVRAFYKHRLGHDYSMDQIQIVGGARPAIYALYRAVVDPGDRVVYGAPSWCNDYYCQIVGAEPVVVQTEPQNGFLPTADSLRPHLRGARLLALNSPLNPAGTMYTAEQLGAICDAVLEENARRGPNERPLYVMYDQVYWMITVGDLPHVDPVGLRPAMAPYTVIVDAISKAFSATGLHTGWTVGPADIIKAMNDVVGHMGGWAPRAEQVATGRFMVDHAAVDRFLAQMRPEVAARLTAMYDGLEAMRRDGLPVDAVKPQGSIYVSGRFALHGRTTPDGSVLKTDDDVRRYLLHSAGLAAIPFSAFGAAGDHGWFRLSIGGVTVGEIEGLMPRIRAAIGALKAK
jgi:aspartate aminotransferase